MSDHILRNPHAPTDAELTKLKLALPTLKKKYVSKADPTQARVNRMKDASLCGICGSAFDKVAKSEANKDVCVECNAKLLEGQTAFITLDGRYAFGKNDGDARAQTLAGRIIPITGETMDKIDAANKL